VGALDLDGIEFLVFDDDVLAFADFVATALVFRGDRFASFLIDELLAQPIAGDLVDLAERDPLRGRGRGLKSDRARDQRQLEIAFPKGTHGETPCQG
jgi:hypothetical protein